MACPVRAEAALLRCALLLLSLSVCSGQRDCTGVDCPRLDNCIEEALESGSCCASCLQKGCTCEGYQYYDCINAGFKNGKVPEGDAYFVDYGSTECSCPAGGGRISCHFISCPDMPPNCIDVSEPADGCMQCERIGCVHSGHKYEAGHSFHSDPCRVCHCPNEGGELMCYPVPDCDPKDVHRPMLAATTEDTAGGRDGYPYEFDQHGHTGQFSTPYHVLPNGNLPLFKPAPFDKQEPEDYDYGPTDLPETYPPSLFLPTQSPSSEKLTSVTGGAETLDSPSAVPSLDGPNKLALRERYGVHDHAVTDDPLGDAQSTVRPRMDEDTATSWRPSQALTSAQSVSFSDRSTQTQSEHLLHRFPLNPSHEGEHHPDYAQTSAEGLRLNQNDTESQSNQQSRSEEVKFPTYTLGGPESPVRPQDGSHGQTEAQSTVAPDTEEGGGASHSVTEVGGNNVLETSEAESERDEKIAPESGTVFTGGPEDHTSPVVRYPTPTVTQWPGGSSTPVQRLFGLPSEDREEVKEQEEQEERPESRHVPGGGPGPGAAEEPLQSCCTAGQRWFTDNRHCNHMPLLTHDQHSVCSVVQKHCCLTSVKESQCDSGMASARGGATCEVDQEDRCPDDSFQVCCSCCALGLRVRAEGSGCDAHRYLGYPCADVFIACCEGEEGASQVPLKRKQKPRPTPVPKKVSDSKYPKEAYSISATDDAANVVDEQEDVDECRLYTSQLCQHKCTNVWGSYVCECHHGYVLQPDRHSCAPASTDEDNRVREEDAPAVVPTQTITTSTSTTTRSSPAQHNPCTGNGLCSQQCAAVGGQARCSCFPGFSLMTDGRTCEDVDECVTNGHSCRPSERCVNTVGSFVCKPQVTCPAGYRLRNGVCHDIDECLLRSHNCGAGFACENTVGSFLCGSKHKCISGFTQDSHGNCIDINECDSLSEPCSSGFNCINTVGSFTCQQKIVMCSHGYHASADGAKCVDTDECQMGTHRCGVGQICHNLPGSYRCDCQTGYQYDALHKVCTDVNECWRYPGRLCAQTCENTPGSYHCSCTAGFALASNGKNCEDVNECEKSPCSQECANIYGSYQCYCRLGYHLKEDGHTCEDIDECQQSIGNICSFQCVNVAGSYQCSCPPHGYTMSANGHTCKDIDECTTGTHNCSHAQTCYNLQGGFRCLSFDCPPNYKKASDTRCERTSCPSNSMDCQKTPVRITYYQLSFQTNIIIPAQIFRIGPSPAYSGDHVGVRITKGNGEGYFNTRKLNSFMGAVYLQRQVREPKDFLIDVEMKLLRQGKQTSFLARIYVFITASAM